MLDGALDLLEGAIEVAQTDVDQRKVGRRNVSVARHDLELLQQLHRLPSLSRASAYIAETCDHRRRAAELHGAFERLHRARVAPLAGLGQSQEPVAEPEPRLEIDELLGLGNGAIVTTGDPERLRQIGTRDQREGIELLGALERAHGLDRTSAVEKR